MKKYLEKFSLYLKSKGLRLTEQRKLVLELMYELRDKQLSIEELFDILKKRDANIGLSTVYRTLILLEEVELVHGAHTKEGYSRYQLGSHSSCQFICSSCGVILSADDTFLESMSHILEKKEFLIKNYRLNLYGCCSKCQEA